jgi:hypothetical protein
MQNLNIVETCKTKARRKLNFKLALAKEFARNLTTFFLFEWNNNEAASSTSWQHQFRE